MTSYIDKTHLEMVLTIQTNFVLERILENIYLLLHLNLRRGLQMANKNIYDLIGAGKQKYHSHVIKT